MKKTAVGAFNGIMHLPTVYEKDGVCGIGNYVEHFASAILD